MGHAGYEINIQETTLRCESNPKNVNITFLIEISDSQRFRYFRNPKITEDFNFKAPYSHKKMTLEEFFNTTKNSQKHLYLYESINHNVLTKESRSWIEDVAQEYDWKGSQKHMLLIGMENNTTPLHYDQQHNFLQILSGSKHFIVFHPKDIENL